MTLHALVDHIDHFQRRVVQDAVTEATGLYWRRRAETFEWVRPRPGDHIGTAGQARADEIERTAVASRDACIARAEVAVLKDVA